MDSLEATILTRILPGDPEFADAVTYACPGRILLDIKHSLAYKIMGVKQGFREDLEQADGPGFNYYSSVVKLHVVRVVLMRRRRRGRALGIKDVSTASLQSDSNTSAVVTLPLTFGTTIVRVVQFTERSAPQRDGKTPSHPGSSPWVSCEVKVRGHASTMKKGTYS